MEVLKGEFMIRSINLNTWYQPKLGNTKDIFFKATPFLFKAEGFNIDPDVVVSSISDQNKVGSGNLCNCHRVSVAGRVFAVKTPKPREQIIGENRDATLKEEAKMLKLTPRTEKIQHLLAYFERGGKYYIVTNFIEGIPLENIERPYNPGLFDDMLSSFFELDKRGVINFDLNEGCFLVKDNKAGIVDFEFAEKMPELGRYEGRLKDDFYNIYRNPYFLRKSNVECFGHRALMGHFLKIRREGGEVEERKLFKSYLRSLSKYSDKLASYFEANAVRLGISEKAIRYEGTLRDLYANPSEQVVDIELAKLEVQYHMMEYHLNGNDKRSKVRDMASALLENVSSLRQGATGEGLQTYYQVNEAWLKDFLSDPRRFSTTS